ncbi:MAG: DUF499 domain-containing protein [Candidatus Hodarchaeota archaeon]
MKPWYKIIKPNSLIRSGQLQETEFTADLLDIVEGKAPPNYQDPQKFFSITFLTKGLSRLLHSIHDKMMFKQGNPIIKLQTPFGGGKTHALIAVYHYVKNGLELSNQLPNGLSTLNIRIGTIGGTYLNPLEGRKVENIRIQTIWGEIAYQLGGKEGYQTFLANDISRVCPGKEKMKVFLQNKQPFLILLDEMVEYVTKARGISVEGSNLAIQTLLFLQELTEVLASLSRGLLIITLPVYQLEAFSEKANDTINQMNQILGRLETTETPVEREEVPKLIIKRFFESLVLPNERDEILSKYTELYRVRRKELPEYCVNPNFINRMRDSYPFHPELIDMLYDRWRSIPTFQGTRAILRILGKTLTLLWSSKTKIDLICPANINLMSGPLKNEFLRNIRPEFDLILNSDIIGINSKAKSLDMNYPAWKNLASDISCTIFLASFSQLNNQKGITNSEIKLCILRPENQPALVTEVIEQIQKKLWYIHYNQGKFFFDFTPNLNRTIQNMKENYRDSYEEELRKIIKKHIGSEFPCYLWPKSSNDISDNAKIKIIVVHPSNSRNFLEELIERKGTSFRIYKNSLIFALPNEVFLSSLIDLIQTKLALIELKNLYDIRKDDKSHDHIIEIKNRLIKIENSLSYNVRKVYSTLFDGKSIISLEIPQTRDEPLTTWYYRELTIKDYIAKRLHHSKLVSLFLGSNSLVSTKLMLEQFFMNPKLMKVLSSQVIQECICSGVKEGAIGLATAMKNIIDVESFRFLTEMNPSEITFSNNEVILTNEISDAILRTIKENPELKEIEIPLKLKKFSQQIMVKKVLNDYRITQKTSSLSFQVSDLDSKFIPAFYRGVLQPLQSKNMKISLVLSLEVQSEEQIPESFMDTLIPETIDQLGAKLTRIKWKKNLNNN